MEKNFDEYYEQKIRPELIRIEEIRKKYERTLDILLWTLAPACLVGASWLINSMGVNEASLKLATLLVFCGGMIIYYPVHAYKKAVKNNSVMSKVFNYLGDFNYKNKGCIGGEKFGFINALFNFFSSDTTVQTEQLTKNYAAPISNIYINDNILEKSKILPNYDRKTTDDCIEGIYKTTNLAIEEIALEQKDSSNNRNKYTTVFRGLVILFEMNKSFNSQTLICRDEGIFNGVAGFFKKDMETVKLEDPIFEKYFEVYSTDQVESRYLLTTAFMERLCKIKEMFKSELKASLFENKLFIAISSSKDWFEVSNIYDPADDKEKIIKVVKELELLLGMADILKLDQKIGL